MISEISERKQLSTRNIALIILLGIFFQAGFQLLSWQFKVLLLYDFTAYMVTCLLGLVPGLLVAIGGGVVTSIFSGVSIYFMIVTVALSIGVYFCCMEHVFQKGKSFMLYSLLIGSVHGAGCYWINYRLNDGRQIFLWTQDPSFGAVVISMCMSAINALICFTVMRMVMKKLPEQLRRQMPFQHWVDETQSFWSPGRYQNASKRTVKRHPLRVRVLAVCTAIMLLGGSFLVFISGKVYRDHSFDNFGEIGLKYANLATNIVRSDEIDTIVAEGGDQTEEYRKMVDQLDRFVDNSDEFVTYLYVYQMELDDNHIPKIRVIYDSDPEGNHYGDVFDTGEEYYDPLREPLSDIKSKKTIGPVVSNGQWGWLMSIYKPVFNEEGKKVVYLGVDLSMDEVMDRIGKVQIQIFCMIALVFMVLIAAIYTCLKYQVVDPVHRLEVMMMNFRDSDPKEVIRSKAMESGDEFENLYDAIISTEEAIVAKDQKLQEYLKKIQELAYRDELTGVKNATAYERKVELLEKEIETDLAEFAVVMVDLNELKQVNDQFGHERGDVAIRKMSQAICQIFTHSPVYRVGGDEFVVILEGRDYQNRESLARELSLFDMHRDLMADAPWEQIALSYGMTVYDRDRDQNYQDVFNRADAEMYVSKKETKRKAQPQKSAVAEEALDKILVVDDEAINYMIMNEMLRKKYQVIYADSGEKALTILQDEKENIAAVLLDMVMPGMGGMEVLHAIRNDVRTRFVPVLVMTSALDMKENVLLEGASQFLPKPFEDQGTILAKIESVIRMAESAQDYLVKSMENMPGGTFVYRDDSEEKVTFANIRLREIFECASIDEFNGLTGGSFRGMVVEEDYATVQKEIRMQTLSEDHSNGHLRYHIRTKTGTIKLIDEYRRYVDDERLGRVFYVFISERAASI